MTGWEPPNGPSRHADGRRHPAGGACRPPVDDIAALGVRRISVGGALALAGWTAFIRAAQSLKTTGSFAGLADLVPYSDINGFLEIDFHARKAVAM